MHLPPALVAILDELQEHFLEGQAFDHFEIALTRRAFNDQSGAPHAAHHESMEWLGDRILGAIVAEELWSRFPHAEPGRLDLARDVLTSEGPLAEIAEELALLSTIQMSAGEAKQDQVTSPKPLSDHVEALVAAAFLCGGWPGATAFVGAILGERYPTELPKSTARNEDTSGSSAMTALNARVQDRWRENIPKNDWNVPRVGGTDNAPIHQATVHLPDGKTITGDALGGKKAAAKASAARAAVAYLDTLGDT